MDKDFDKETREKAMHGDAEAQFDMYMHYRNAHDEGEAEKWCRKAAERKHPYALLDLAFSCMETKPAKSVELFRLAEEQGCIYAAEALGKIYEEGDVVPQDMAESFKWYRKAAGYGLHQAMYKTAVCYRYGKGTEPDYDQAYKLFHDLATQDTHKTVEAQRELALCYKKGLGVPVDARSALKWLRTAMDGGDIMAMRHMADCYWEGFGVEKDAAEAERLLCQLAGYKILPFMYELAKRYETGDGVPQSLSLAMKWYTDCAHERVPMAKEKMEAFIAATDPKTADAEIQFRIGSYYYEGRTPDFEQAAEWYRLAAKAGHVEAQFRLSFCYAELALFPNPVLAMRWLRTAAANGHPQAEERIKWIEDHYGE